MHKMGGGGCNILFRFNFGRQLIKGGGGGGCPESLMLWRCLG